MAASVDETRVAAGVRRGEGAEGDERVLIALRGVALSFDTTEVLRGIDLDVYERETVVVVGPSGAGKSTILKIILRLLIPDAGEVVVEGREITRMSFEQILEVRRKIGMVFQEAALFDSLSVYENVAYPLREHMRLREGDVEARVRHALERVDLDFDELGDRLPAELSGGQKKRVGIARAIVHEPEILLFDEPTAALDPVTSATIVELIQRLQAGLEVTGVVVTHDVRVASRIATRIAMLRDGRIAFLGTPEEVRRSDDSYVRLFFFG